MAKRKGGSLGWFVIGVLLGIVAVAAIYFYATRDQAVPAPEGAEPVLPSAPSAGPPPIAGAPTGAAPPAAVPPTPTAPTAAVPGGGYREPSDEERQIADDAAATGMTGPVNPPADQPTN